MKIDAVLHNEVLVAGMEHVRIDRRNNVDCKVIRADHADLFVSKPFRTFQAYAWGAVVE